MKSGKIYKIHSKVLTALLLACIPVAALCCVEFYTHVPWDLTVPIFLVNLLFYYLVYVLATFLLGKVSRGYCAATVFFMLCGFANYCVVSFRSSPIVPWDIYSLRTAVSVADNYSLEISGQLMAVLLAFAGLFVLSLLLPGRFRKHAAVRAGGVAVCCIAVCCYTKALADDRVIEAVGLDTTLFTPNVLYRNNGIAGGFLGNMKYLKVEKPDGYSAEAAEEIAARYQMTDTDAASADTEDLPNIIVIMNESFSDLSVFGDFATDQEWLPFISSLSENTIKGNCYVSVKGGNTANSEYEFLTGDSMAFMPAGSVPYQQYVKSELPSLATYLSGLGYQTTAIHPYNASGWNRDTVYPLLGFASTVFKNDFVNPKKIRNYISDESAFEKIIELYEKKDADDRLFTFEVTMQNHGGYSRDTADFTESVHLTDLTAKNTQIRAAEKYLTLMNESDQAFKNLVEYFEQQDEDTIILMFGDHQPSDYITNVILRLLGLNRDTDQDVYYDNYIVPYVIWANYDIDTTEVENISVNYLSTLLIERAGVTLTGYQKYLKALQQEYPAITANMVMTADGERSAFEDADDRSLKDYNVLVYNHLCDADGRVQNFYD